MAERWYTLAMKRALLGLLLVVGCGVPAETTPEREMLSELWWYVYGEPGPVPEVTWVEGVDLNCDGGHGPNTGWVVRKSGNCVDGYIPTEGVVLVARWPGARLEQMALAHEFAHHARYYLTDRQDWDGHHVSPHFQRPGGADEQGEQWLANYEASPLPAP